MATNCEEAVYSEEYEDYIIEYYGQEEEARERFNVDCYQFLTTRFSIIYKKASEVNQAQRDSLLILPRVFGLLSSDQTLEAAGITRVKRSPNLNLTGQGVLFGIIDTGAAV